MNLNLRRKMLSGSHSKELIRTKNKSIHRIVSLSLSIILPIVFLGLMSQVNVYADNLVVNTTADGGVGSLRQAVVDANQNPGPDTITFDLAPQSIITLTYGQLWDFIVISDTLTIDGGTAVSLSISGNNERNIFTIGAGTAVTITDLTLMNGQYDGGAIHNDGGDITILRTAFIQNGSESTLYGGAIFNKHGEMNIQDSQFLSNKSEYGAGILNDGDIDIINTLFRNNTGRYGAGIQNCGGGMVNITSSQFLENSAIYIGSAVYNRDANWVDQCGVKDIPGTVNISNTVFSKNHAGGAGTVLNDEMMRIEFSTIHLNEAEHDGGGIGNAGTLTVLDSTIVSNTANISNGGAIHQFTGTITISHSIIENNVAVDHGGGLSISGGKAIIENSAIISNTGSSSGGGIFNDGNLEIANSTISGNQAMGESVDDGGGGIIQRQGTAVITITQSTIANNVAPHQAGRDGVWQVDGTVLIQQSIVAGNGTENCTLDAGNWDGHTYNLADDASCTSFTEADPMLAPLGNYGGNTLTHALLEGSSALDAGNNVLCSDHDQRGEVRPLDGNRDGTVVCDIGAVEMGFSQWKVYLPSILR